ncbi:DUF2141 domain-containing protein [Phenylobacterium sp.]|jgi:uncharacterized protein (DUF2141 family)|uniref:DUF2141 domain-containing protein n=1 Tax=Phenylobacterium sp. TaxID=1871053 RepID=UPI002F94FA95
MYIKLALLLASLAATPAAAGDITLTFETAEPKGQVMVALYASEADYDGNKPRVAQMASAAAAPVKVSFNGLPPGRYAVKSFHDLNGDGKMNANAFGMPIEPLGFSNNAPVRMAAPSWGETVFEVGADGAAQTIKLQ